uniref:V-type proton ATPase subunit D n=3 Tax=Canis lupus TaxID=9612 RepID=A0A8C0PCR6_CANLF
MWAKIHVRQLPRSGIVHHQGSIKGSKTVQNLPKKQCDALTPWFHQTPFVTGDEAVNGSVNATEHVIIPRIGCALACIITEFNVRERNFYRLKKIQKKKKILQEKSEQDVAQQKVAGEGMEPTNLLAGEKRKNLFR